MCQLKILLWNMSNIINALKNASECEPWSVAVMELHNRCFTGPFHSNNL